MIYPFIAAVTLLSATSAEAACHHYARWYYPYPQPRCGIWSRHTTHATEDHSWYVEITKVPDERDEGLEKLKELLK